MDGQARRMPYNGRHQALDPVGGQLPADQVGGVVVGAGAGRVGGRGGVDPVHPANARGQLDAQLGAVHVDPLCHLAQHVHVLAAGQLLAGGRLKFLRCHHSAGHHQAHAAPGAFAVVVDIPHVEGVAGVGCGAHGRHHDSVFQPQRANLDGAEKAPLHNRFNTPFRKSAQSMVILWEIWYNKIDTFPPGCITAVTYLLHLGNIMLHLSNTPCQSSKRQIIMERLG